METLRRFRLVTVRLSLMATALLALLGYAFSRTVGFSLLLGGLGGTLVFWIDAYRLEKLASSGQKQVKFGVSVWGLAGLGIYVLVLHRGYTLDPDAAIPGLLAAAGGLFIVRAVCAALGLTGLDLRKRED